MGGGGRSWAHVGVGGREGGKRGEEVEGVGWWLWGAGGDGGGRDSCKVIADYSDGYVQPSDEHAADERRRALGQLVAAVLRDSIASESAAAAEGADKDKRAAGVPKEDRVTNVEWLEALDHALRRGTGRGIAAWIPPIALAAALRR